MAGFLADKGLTALRNGYNVVPIKPGTKYPLIKGWERIQMTPAHIKRWLANGHANDGVGITTARTPFVDLDIRDPDLALQMQDIINLDFGLPGLMRIGNAPKRGLIFEISFCKISSAVYLDEQGRENRVEVLGESQQFRLRDPPGY